MESARRDALDSVVAETVKGNTSLLNCTLRLPCEKWRLCWRCRLKIKNLLINLLNQPMSDDNLPMGGPTVRVTL